MSCDMFESDMPKLMTGWMLKRKSAGGVSKILCDTNKRFFTLDFENQILFYQKSEAQKQVSLPVPFSEIMSIEAVGNAEPHEVVQAPAKSGRFSMPKIPKIPKRNAGWDHGIVVHGKDKKMELLLNSEEEASKWLAALQYAARAGDAKRRGEFDPDLVKAEQSTAAGSSGASGSGSSTPHGDSPRDCIPEVIGGAGTGLLSECGSEQRPSSALESMVVDADAASPRPPVLQPVESQPASQQVGSHRSTGHSGYKQNVSGSDGARRVSKRGNARSKGVETSSLGTSAWGMSNAERTAPVSRYADQGQGLSLKERLERLNFSDSEDEEEPEAEKSFAKHTGTLDNMGGAVEGDIKKSPRKLEEAAVESFEAWDSEDES